MIRSRVCAWDKKKRQGGGKWQLRDCEGNECLECGIDNVHIEITKKGDNGNVE